MSQIINEAYMDKPNIEIEEQLILLHEIFAREL